MSYARGRAENWISSHPEERRPNKTAFKSKDSGKGLYSQHLRDGGRKIRNCRLSLARGETVSTM